jgi:hypothetical protein
MTKKIARLVGGFTLGMTVLAGGLTSATAGEGIAAVAHEHEPGLAVRVGDHTYFADGTVKVEVPAGTFSLSDCDAGRFCVWSQSGYFGSFRYRTGSGVKSLGGTVGSFWNNRSSVARLYSNTGNSSTCYENGAKKSSVTSGYSSASQVNLSSASSC